MAEEYLRDSLLLKAKDKITIGCLHKNWYLVDGQHRIEMGKCVYTNHAKNGYLCFCWYICKDESSLKKLFDSVNKDSLRNQYYINVNDTISFVKHEFTGKLKKYHPKTFATKITTNGRFKTIEEFVKELDEINYFKEYKCSQQAYQNIINKNKEFYDICRYDINMEKNPSLFYKPEKNLIEQKVIFSMKSNNFVEWLNKKEEPYHKTKIIKSNISNYKRNIVWEREFGNTNSGKCPISFCKHILRRGQGVRNGYQCGHKISEFNGGITEPANLRPICASCNQSMGKKDWDVYELKIIDINPFVYLIKNH